MKLYACTKGNGYICSFDVSMQSDKYKKLFKKFKKLGLTQKAYLRINDKDEKSIKKAVEKLDFILPTEIEVYPETIQLIKMPYPRRAGLDKVGKFITYYQVEIAICTLPSLYYLIFDEEDNIREDAIRNIWCYLHNKWNETIKEIYEKVSPDDGYLDYMLSEEDKVEVIRSFLKSLEITLSDVMEMPLNNTIEIEEAFYLNDIVSLTRKLKEKKYERKLK